MMSAAIVLMFTQILMVGSYPVVSLVCFPLALVWLASQSCCCAGI